MPKRKHPDSLYRMASAHRGWMRDRHHAPEDERDEVDKRHRPGYTQAYTEAMTFLRGQREAGNDARVTLKGVTMEYRPRRKFGTKVGSHGDVDVYLPECIELYLTAAGRRYVEEGAQ